MKKTKTLLSSAVAVLALAVFVSCASVSKDSGSHSEVTFKKGTLTIAGQGHFSAGGTVRFNDGVLNPNDVYSDRKGQSVHGGHASVFYQIPVNPRKYGIVFLHGNGQSSKCWSTTPDGREGFQTLFLRAGFGVYLVDQPGRGQAAQNIEDATVLSDRSDQMRFDQFRLGQGQWPNFYERIAFPKDEESLNQFYRQMTPTVGNISEEVRTKAMKAVFERTGDAVFFTHSAGGSAGWNTAMETDKVKAIVALEPGSFVYPENEAPEWIENLYVNFPTPTVSPEKFERLTKIPIVIYFGDNIPDEHSTNAGQDWWYAVRRMADYFAETVNRHGGDVTIVDLPKIGLYGNTHFIFSDTNNDKVAENILSWMHEKGLDAEE
ncbi:MAG: alpha/beta fold hydrolase [Treponema sp.]|nr:alpha/beta fold hydrolase [Spirochaetia bacterium]MDD7458872.1 alpha/beta fold hydrolase [Spirochaetales bacterium]MDY5810893.1 alpha/beta fold hydrolase [Treponema sp.]